MARNTIARRRFVAALTRGRDDAYAAAVSAGPRYAMAYGAGWGWELAAGMGRRFGRAARARVETAAVLTVAAVTVAGIAGAGYAVRDTAPAPELAPVAATADGRGGYPPCEYEDSNGCVWDARHMGNGHGRSFLATRDGRVIYLPHRAAHALQLPGVW